MLVNSPKAIPNIMFAYKIKHLKVVTGSENCYIENEEKFIFTPTFLSNQPLAFAHSTDLISVDFRDFDFNEIKNMSSWFYRCTNLTNIYFPTVVNAQKLYSLCSTFAETNIKKLNLSNWNFGAYPIDLSGCVENCPSLESVTIGEVNITEINHFSENDTNLHSITFQNTYFIRESGAITSKPNFIKNIFKNCKKLKQIDFSTSKNSRKFLKKSLKQYKEMLKSIPEDCLIILPN